MNEAAAPSSPPPAPAPASVETPASTVDLRSLVDGIAALGRVDSLLADVEAGLSTREGGPQAG